MNFKELSANYGCDRFGLYCYYNSQCQVIFQIVPRPFQNLPFCDGCNVYKLDMQVGHVFM
jgi:hypothetical protein